ncbi:MULTISPECIES: LytTR family DNA-binding domain-containing protein [unclassified Bifidobacterium]|uniref:LytTR family DNA-binding domain-containing protein n=1 Tax=unclassified Bifidobacterium TaxID=2608897 RepID=UPI0023F9B4EF|nr:MULTISPECIES: LytTR family DNA-binding domain-containing protein [unclassified Bifidobacterium]WEV65700.1 LytTR family DNA-binding domain-containing protein [Bifidobacterium sp. ESL0764]WEV75512.1 LytTR family DNA-binding domain-containing protein [Bifidobacterium sp. ESL0800]
MDVTFQANSALPQGQVNVIVEASEFSNNAEQALKSIQALGNRRVSAIPVTTQTGLQLVRESDIVALEVQGSLVLIRILAPAGAVGAAEDEGVQVVATADTLVHVLSLLPATCIRVSKQAAININQLQSLEGSYSGNMTAHLTGGIDETVSRRYVDALRRAIGA